MQVDRRPWGVLAWALFLAGSLLHHALTRPEAPGLRYRDTVANVPNVIPIGAVGPGWNELLANTEVDVNLAPEAVLRQLPGIGPKLAARIARERERRPFTGLSDLTRVRGLGARSVAKLRGSVRFSVGPAVGARVGPASP